MGFRGKIRIAFILAFVLSVCSFVSPEAGFSAQLFDVQQLTGITMDKAVLWGPGRLAIAGDGTLYVVDSYKNHVVKFDRNGNYIGDIAFPRASAVAVSVDGSLYIGSHKDYSVAIYRNGRIAGYLGSGPGEFSSVRDIAVDNATGRVYVADSVGNAIRVFTASGQDLGTIAGVNLPVGVEVTADAIYVLDAPVVQEQQSRTTASRISIFTKTHVLMNTIDDYGKYRIFRPTDIAVADGILYISDAKIQGVVLFDTAGTYLGMVQSMDGLMRVPVSLALSSEGVLYVSSSETHSIQMFAITPAVSMQQGGQQ